MILDQRFGVNFGLCHQREETAAAKGENGFLAISRLLSEIQKFHKMSFYLEATDFDGVTAEFTCFADGAVTAIVPGLVRFADSVGPDSGDFTKNSLEI